MYNSIRLRIERVSNENTNWFYDTIFTDHPLEQKIDLSDGDCDSKAGDLEEWVFVTYEYIPEVNKLFESKYPDAKNFIFSDEQQNFYYEIKNSNVKQLFRFLCIYCTQDHGNMSSFKELLDENKIKNEYSCYRDSGDW
ncbi:MAG: hypothetical protein J5527_08045 [Treponema sp.]|nr:hypothetical protein [Treponema sp.]